MTEQVLAPPMLMLKELLVLAAQSVQDWLPIKIRNDRGEELEIVFYGDTWTKVVYYRSEDGTRKCGRAVYPRGGWQEYVCEEYELDPDSRDWYVAPETFRDINQMHSKLRDIDRNLWPWRCEVMREELHE